MFAGAYSRNLEGALMGRVHAASQTLGLCNDSGSIICPPQQQRSDGMAVNMPFNDTVAPVFEDYMEFFKIWQRWNMFAPNPMASFHFYVAEVREQNGEWRTFKTYHKSGLGLRDRWYKAQIIRDLPLYKQHNFGLHEYLMSLDCEEHSIAPNRDVRYRVIRNDVYYEQDDILSKKFWSDVMPERWHDSVMYEGVCPDPS